MEAYLAPDGAEHGRGAILPLRKMGVLGGDARRLHQGRELRAEQHRKKRRRASRSA